MNAIAARVVAIAVAVLALVAGVLYVKALRAELAEASENASTAQETVKRRDATIADMQKKERDNAKALAQLETKRSAIAGDLAQKQTDFEALKHENESLRTWADGALPDDVVRLYDRPAITGADAYLAMRAGHALHAAGEQAAHE
jgi:LysB family phage lysis regulatory protein